MFKKNLNNAAGFGKKLFGIAPKVEEARKFSAAPSMKIARAPRASGEYGGVIDELRALKNSGLVSKARPGEEVSIDISETEEPPADEPVEEPPADEPVEEPPADEPVEEPPTDGPDEEDEVFDVPEEPPEEGQEEPGDDPPAD